MNLPPGGSDTGGCERAECENAATTICTYIDRRGRQCDSHWCDEHIVEVRDSRLCARHASTVTAVGEEAMRLGQLPELTNRVPALVYWLGRDLEEDIRVMLEGVMNSLAGETVVVDPVTLIPGGGRMTERRWERNWKVVSHTGISHKVTVQVVEGSPIDVVVRVGQVVVARETPPWIAAREAGRELGEAEDAETRRDFYRTLHNAIADGLSAESNRR